MNFYSIVSKAYDLLDIIYFSEKGQNPRDVINAMIPKDSLRVLDLCCGTLSNSIPIALENQNCKVMGVDISKEMLRAARKKVKKLDIDNIKLRCIDATDTKLGSKSFDFVVIGLVLHECSSEMVNGIMREAHRLVKDTGRLIILEWKKPDNGLQVIKFTPIYLGEIINNRAFNTFYYADKKNLFESFGFKLEQVEDCNYTAVYSLSKGL